MVFHNIININSGTAVPYGFGAGRSGFFDYLGYYVYSAGFMKVPDIPVFLVNEETMRKYDPDTTVYYRANGNRLVRDSADYSMKNSMIDAGINRPPTEWLGFYQRRKDDLFDNSQIIVVCPERIAKTVKSRKEFMLLFSMVVVHEYAHARMDKNGENEQYGPKDDFFYWMEESLANFLTVEFFFHRFNDEKLGIGRLRARYKSGRSGTLRKYEDFILHFVKHQPPNYALGAELFLQAFQGMYAVPLNQWPEYKKILGSGNKNKLAAKNKWLNYVQKRYSGAEHDKLRELYSELFE